MKSLLFILIVIQLVGSTVMQLVIIKFIGVGKETDAYMASLVVPAVLAVIITGIVQNVWLPELVKAYQKSSSFFNEQLSFMLGQVLIFSLIYIVFYVWSDYFLKYFYSSFDEYTLGLTADYTKMSIITAFLGVLAGGFSTAQRAKGRYILVEAAGAISILISIPIIYFSIPEWGIGGVLLVLISRGFMVVLFHFISLGCPFFKLLEGGGNKTLWKKTIPLLLSQPVLKSSSVIDRYWASQSAVGALSLFSLAFLIASMIASVIERVVVMPFLPVLKNRIISTNLTDVSRELDKILLKIMMIVLVVGFVGVICKSYFYIILNIVGLTEPQTEVIWWLVFCLLGYVYASPAGALISGFNYALGDTKTPAIVSMIGYFVSIFLKMLMFKYYDLKGLVVAVSLYYLINFIILYVKTKSSVKLVKDDEVYV
jgi:putative peptidoglycan lipid II flippase